MQWLAIIYAALYWKSGVRLHETNTESMKTYVTIRLIGANLPGKKEENFVSFFSLFFGRHFILL